MEKDITKLWSGKNQRYQIECSCGSKKHTCDISIEVSKKLNIISMIFYIELHACSYLDKWYKRLWWRIKTSFKLLIFGYTDLKHNFIFENENHIRSFIDSVQRKPWGL